MALSVFEEKPTEKELELALGPALRTWAEIKEYVMSKNLNLIDEWHTSGKKYGWTYRIKDRKRAIIYFIPLEQSFKLGFVLGKKATEKALQSDISTEMKQIIRAAPVYAEGRGFRIDLQEISNMEDIKTLVRIKMEV